MGLNTSKLNKCEEKNKELKTQNVSLNSQIEELNTTNMSLNSYIEELNKDITQLKAQTSLLNSESTRIKSSQKKPSNDSNAYNNGPVGGTKRQTKLRKTRKHCFR